MRFANVQGRASLASHSVHVKRNFLDFRFLHLYKDNFTTRDPWIWRWPWGKRRGRSLARWDLILWLSPSWPACSSCQKMNFLCKGITLFWSLQRRIHDSLAVTLSVFKRKTSKIQNNGKNRKSKNQFLIFVRWKPRFVRTKPTRRLLTHPPPHQCELKFPFLAWLVFCCCGFWFVCHFVCLFFCLMSLPLPPLIPLNTTSPGSLVP